MTTSPNSPPSHLRIRLFASAAVLCAVLAAVFLRPEADDAQIWLGWGVMALSLVMTGLALRANARLAPSAAPRITHTPPPHQPRWKLVGIGAALLLINAEISGQALQFAPLSHISIHVQFALWCLAVGLIIIGLGGTHITRPTLTRAQKIEIVVMIALFALALFLRVIGLSSAIRTMIDESHWHDGVLFLRHHPTTGIIGTASTYLPSTLFYSYFQFNAIEWMGRSLASLRITSAIIGSCSVVALYMLTRTRHNRTTAFIAALLLATFPPHIHFSRIALAHVIDALIGTLAFMFALRGISANGTTRDWTLVGVLIGLTQYFYEGGRLLFPPVMILWLIWMAIWQRDAITRNKRGILIAGLAAFLVAFPVYYTIAARGAPLLSRMQAAGTNADYWQKLFADGITQDAVNTVIERVTVPLKMIVHQPETAMYYAGDQPLIVIYFVPFFVLGLGYILWRICGSFAFVGFWLLATLIGNALIYDVGQTPRYVVVFPALALIMALGLTRVLPLAWRTANESWIIQRVPVLLIAVVIAFAQSVYYFGVHLTRYQEQIYHAFPHPDAPDAVIRANETLPATTQIILISDPVVDQNVPRNLDSLLRDNTEERRLIALSPQEVTLEYLLALPRTHDYAFFVAPEEIKTIMLLDQILPLNGPYYSPYNIPQDRAFILFHVPPK